MPSREPVALDDFDRAILDVLQRDAKTPQRTIGEEINLSAPAVQRRIKRLEESGVILANVAVVDPAALGASVTVITQVEVESEQVEQLDRLKQSFKAHPQVQQCYYVTGAFDFTLVIVVRSMADYEALTRQIFHGNPNVKRFHSFFAMDRVKVGLSVELR